VQRSRLAFSWSGEDAKGADVMIYRTFSVAQGIAFVSVLLLSSSVAQAQTSAYGHAPAPGSRTPYNLRGLPAFGIYPGDHMFQATMKIGTAYQAAEHALPVTVYRRPAPRVVHEEAASMEVSVTEPEEPTEMVPIRGPDGEVRSFPLVGGRKAIKARTIIVRPGQTLNLMVHGSSITVTTKQ
jgi:hypothetical protein